MRFVWAIAAFVLAALMIGLGIAQRTVLAPPPAESQGITTDSDARYTLVEGEVLTSVPGAQTLTVDGSGTVFAAYGRADDVRAWLADAEYNHVTLAADGTLDSEVVAPAEDASTATPAPSDAETAPEAQGVGVARSPVGSDLWLDEFQQEGSLSTPLRLPETMSVLVASDGTAPAPADISVSWPVDDSTPWAGPLIIGGGIVLLVGVVLYLLGIRHVRRGRGPRRKGLPMPQTEPIDVAAVDGADKGVISSSSPRRSILGRRKLVVPIIAATALLATGCSADVVADRASSDTPSPSASVIVPEGQQQPAVTEAQAARILTRASTAVADADAAADPALAAARLSGAALAERETNYALRKTLADQPALPAIPDKPVEIVLPQAYDDWPRSFMTVVEGADADAAPTIMVLTQADPWSEYKISYLAALEASTTLPDLAAPYLGASLAPPDSSFLLLPPQEIAAAYADVIDNGQNSPYWGQFDTADDKLLPGIAADRQRRLDEFNQTAQQTGTLEFASTAGSHAPLALTTLDGGAIVAVDVLETDTARPTSGDAVIRLSNNAIAQALTGVDQSATGFAQTYADQLFFYVPLDGSSERIRLLGYRSNILEAKVNE